jgi:hypothetical protein
MKTITATGIIVRVLHSFLVTPAGGAMVGEDNGGELLTSRSDFDQDRCVNMKVANFDEDALKPVKTINGLLLPLNVSGSSGERVVISASSPAFGNYVGDLRNSQFTSVNLDSNGSWRSDQNDGRGGFAFIGSGPAIGFFMEFEFQDSLKCCVGAFVN